MGRARLQMRDGAGSTSDRLVLKWRGAATTQLELGDPVSADAYTLCVYDESGPTPQTLVSATVPPGGMCGTRACWTSVPAKGFKYASRNGAPDGIVRLRVKPGVDDAARTSLTAKGTALDVPALPLALPARAQLRATNGLCQQSVYSTGGVRRNDAQQFSGRADGP